MKRIKITDLLQLEPKHALFVIEYVKDCATRRAAESAGYSGDYGYKLLNLPEVSNAIDHIFQNRLEANMIDTDWLLFEMVDNHMIARQQGNVNASNKALSIIAKHKAVDAMASDKLNINVDSDKEVLDRLRRGRERSREEQPPVSFM